MKTTKKAYRILIVGGGGREHALAWKLAQDSRKPAIFCAPGNAGTAALGVNVAIPATDVQRLLGWAREYKPDLVVIGPEAPLCEGLADALTADGCRVFGPCAAAAQLEGSKVFSKEIMEAAGVPTAEARHFTSPDEARAYLRKQGAPIVIKADGLAAGKGVYVCATLDEALAAVDEVMVNRAFGEAGGRLLIEEFLEGEEASILALVSGDRVVMLASSQDHKRIHDHDQGPNTGGMGAYSPAPVVTPALWPELRDRVFMPVIQELKRRGIDYRGVLYAGIMVTPKGPKVLEFNCRFGDPETQAVLARWDGDLLPALESVVEGSLEERHVRWKPETSVCVVMAAGGYPGDCATGHVITGLDQAASVHGAVVFHAGTRLKDGQVLTAGGRVLGVTATGHDLRQAIDRAYAAAGHIHFTQAHYRKDIGWRALKTPHGKQEKHG